MFKQIIDAFRKTDEMGRLCELFAEMLDDGLWLFQQALPLARGQGDPEAGRDDFYARDKHINALEREIRRRIVIHLVAGNEQDVGFSLVLMSVIKDAERIGDYGKNVRQIGEVYRGRYTRAAYVSSLDAIAEGIAELFPQVRRAFLEGSKTPAKRAVERSILLRGQCDMLINQLLTPGGDVPGDESAALALRTRYFKRIAAHLGNIATSVTNPVPMLDYHKNKPLDEPEG